MKNLVLLLILVSGFLSGYLVGDYRGKDARESLKKAVETGKTLDSEREAAITQLKTELEGINARHQRELETIRKDNETRVAAWRRSKDGLNDKIKRSSAMLSESDTELKSLVTRRDGASGAERTRLELEIARLQKERDGLRAEIEGGSCLQARVPHSVYDALNEEIVVGRK